MKDKNYRIKRNANGKFKILNLENDELFAGFEDKEFGSPIEAGRFMSLAMKKTKGDEEMNIAEKASTVSVGVDILKNKDVQSVEAATKLDIGDIPVVDAIELAKAVDKAQADAQGEMSEEQRMNKRIGCTKMFKIVIPKQSNSDNNRPVIIPNHDGGRDWRLERGKEYTVPAYVVNILKESIAVTTELIFESGSRGIKTIPMVESIPRFSLQINESFMV